MSHHRRSLLGFALAAIAFALLLPQARALQGTAAAPSDNGPAGFFLAAANAAKENRADHIWKALPQSYRDDITGLIKSFASKMDSDLWARATGMLDKLGRLLGEKKQLIQGNAMAGGMLQQSGIPMEELNKQWDETAAGLRKLAKGQLASLESMKTIDVEKLLREDVSGLLPSVKAAGGGTYFGDAATAKIMTKVDSLKVTVVEQAEDLAKVRLELEGEEPETVEVKRVDGVWVPKEMHDGWATGIAEAKAGVEGMTIAPQEKAQALMMIGMFDGVLDQLLKAETQAQFDATFQGIFGMLGPMMGGAGAGPAPGGTPPAGGEGGGR